MRVAPLAMIALAGLGCRRGALQQDAGTGFITGDGAPGGDTRATGDGLPGGDAPGDSPGLADVRWPTADANCGQREIVGGLLASQILVVYDRSVATATNDWNMFLSGVTQTITANDSRIDWGLYVFPDDGPACGAGTVGPVNLPPVPDAAFHVIAHLVAAGTGASGSPTAAAIDTAAAFMLSLADQSPKMLMLVTDAAPTCAGTADALSLDPAQAQIDAVGAIADAAAAGLPTLVVAPSATSAAADVDALNALAVAGGYPQSPSPRFFTEKTIGPLLTAPDASCTFALSADPPPVPDAVVVTFNGLTVPRDRSHVDGWDYVDARALSITLYGSWCEPVKTNRSWKIVATFGCPL
ncbi:MAG TPA: hypothetical protein VN903_24360 [Polyangia bacterium]|nr:hypothetical protein [Polyangia bacterium]